MRWHDFMYKHDFTRGGLRDLPCQYCVRPYHEHRITAMRLELVVRCP